MIRESLRNFKLLVVDIDENEMGKVVSKRCTERRHLGLLIDVSIMRRF